jgi:hypothetical protein
VQWVQRKRGPDSSHGSVAGWLAGGRAGGLFWRTGWLHRWLWVGDQLQRRGREGREAVRAMRVVHGWHSALAVVLLMAGEQAWRGNGWQRAGQACSMVIGEDCQAQPRPRLRRLHAARSNHAWPLALSPHRRIAATPSALCCSVQCAAVWRLARLATPLGSSRRAAGGQGRWTQTQTRTRPDQTSPARP